MTDEIPASLVLLSRISSAALGLAVMVFVHRRAAASARTMVAWTVFWAALAAQYVWSIAGAEMGWRERSWWLLVAILADILQLCSLSFITDHFAGHRHRSWAFLTTVVLSALVVGLSLSEHNGAAYQVAHSVLGLLVIGWFATRWVITVWPARSLIVAAPLLVYAISYALPPSLQNSVAHAVLSALNLGVFCTFAYIAVADLTRSGPNTRPETAPPRSDLRSQSLLYYLWAYASGRLVLFGMTVVATTGLAAVVAVLR